MAPSPFLPLSWLMHGHNSVTCHRDRVYSVYRNQPRLAKPVPFPFTGLDPVARSHRFRIEAEHDKGRAGRTTNGE